MVVLLMINKNTNSIYKASQFPLILQSKPKAAGKVQAAALGAGLQSFLTATWALPVLGLEGSGPDMGCHVQFNRWMMKCSADFSYILCLISSRSLLAVNKLRHLLAKRHYKVVDTTKSR